MQLFNIPWRKLLRQLKIKQFNLFAFKYLGSVLDGWFDKMVLTNKHIHSKKLKMIKMRKEENYWSIFFYPSMQLFNIPWRKLLRQLKIKQFNLFAFKYLGSVLDGWFDKMVLTNKHIHSKKLSCVTYHFLGFLISLCLRVILFTARFR